VLNVLGDLGLGEAVEDGLIEVMNKIDLLDTTARRSIENQRLRNSHSVALSAATGEGCDTLLELLDRRLERADRVVRLDIPLTDGRTLAWLYRRGEVIGRRDDNESAHLSVRLSEADIARLQHRQRLH
jgi:GTPase